MDKLTDNLAVTATVGQLNATLQLLWTSPGTDFGVAAIGDFQANLLTSWIYPSGGYKGAYCDVHILYVSARTCLVTSCY